MPQNNENKPTLRITERRQFQFDELDEMLLTIQNPSLAENDRQNLEQRINRLKFIISVQGSDGCEFEYRS